MQTPLATSVPNMIYRFTIKKVIAQKEGEIFRDTVQKQKKTFIGGKCARNKLTHVLDSSFIPVNFT